MASPAPASDLLRCRYCGRLHRPVELKLGERALCAHCGAPLRHRAVSRDAALAFTVAALVLAVPAVILPLVTVRKFGPEHASYLWTGVRALWAEGMPLLSVWVALCGMVVPLALLTTLTMVVASARFGDRSRTTRVWAAAAHALQHWSMPEVQVLAILVAFVKIGALVQVDPGPGLWFYGGMTFAMLFAWRSAELGEAAP